ncbi:mediator of RNA polymerase II transcription subunit 12-like isoform X6 [Hyposmocoma kahamanoa]|uniref:mediator of RNA polymerase II transcription subunit 12-like isoform X6 n=1 Tax=Hyposmocoma kahamanoa TaxID=1477025 RepID=UPI000E6D6F67|nr:mediator of RNA polymerase II transcription subunit 12-like isoform X6 [Hyposmocoma kahamanoa]
MGIMYEKRPLKRPRLGPPDVYPQEPRQKEDELTSTNVKHGFSTTPQSSDEFGTARNFNYSSSKIGQFFSGILSKKEELNTLPDCGRKRQQVNPKDNFWPATARTKAQIEAWFKDLAGSKPLSQLAKKAPNFNKKEEIFITLTEYQVAMPRAAWFIKLSSAYTVAVSEAKIKKRQLPDPTTEWTTTLIKFLKDQIPKLAEHYQSAIPGNEKTPPSQSGQGTPSHSSSGNPPGSSTPNSTIPNSMHSPGNTSTLGSTTPGSESIDWRQALRLWNYCTRLAKYLLDEGLLDRHDFLTWIIELLDKRAPDDGLLRLFLPLALQHMCEFVCCEGLSRRLATTCAKKAAAICSVLSETTLRTLNQPAVFSKQADRTDTNGVPLSPAPNETPNGDVKLNISQIKRSATPADQNQGTLNANSLGTPNPNHSLGTPNPTHSLGTPNPTQPMEVQVKEENESPPRDNKPTITSVITASLNPVQVGFGEILNCAYHRDVIIQLATILQIICIECPTAMVWSGCGSHLQGSPLDLLPLPPSALPMPHMDSSLTEEHRRMVYESEQEIAARSKKAESKWCTDKWQTSSQARVLAVLEALDRHCFDRVDQNNNLDTLYKEVFANCTPPSKDAVDTKDQEWPCSYAVVKVLCEWAVCGARWGEHRAMAAAALLDKRQHQLLHQHHDHHATGSDDKESVSSGQGLYNGPPIFQNLLLRFLDNDAPVLVSFSDESPSPPPGNRQQFANLVHLFGELIRRDVFSHDAYMCTLISRGDLISPTEPASSGTANCHTVAPPANSSGTNHNMDDDIFAGIDLKPKMEENVRMDLDDSKIDDDLDKLLQHIKEDQQNSMDAPDSPKDPGEPSHSVNSPMMGPSGMSIPGMQSMGMGPMSVPGMRTTSAGPSSVCPTPASVSRHYHYTMHFPLPPAEPDHTPHDANQRHILLYGVGRQRDEAKHVVKKMTKEICKLFSKKFSIDVAEGGKIKKHSRSEFNFEAVTQKFQSMSMYEQGAVSWAVGGAVCEALAAFSSGATSYLPQPEHVAFALDLCEIALNVHGLIDTCIQILKELSEVEGALISRGAPSSGLAAPRAYTSALALYTVGALRRYHSCLLLCVEQTSAVFEQLCRLVKCVVNPGDCGSAERCVLAQLHDLYKAAAHLCHAPHADTFANAYPKIKQALYSPLTPTPSSYVYNPQFLSEFFTNPRKGKIEIAWARQVAESPVNRYSFVCSAMLAVCREVDNDRVNELGVLCAEMTAWCSSLAAEWLGALVALCGAQHYPAGAPPHTAPPPLYPDLLHHRDLHDAAAHDALAVFTCILVARHCFSLEDFVRHAALPSLLKACGGGGVSGGGGGSHRDCKSHQSPSYKGSTGAGSGGKRGVSGSSCGGGCGCGGGNNIRLANEPLLSLVLTCLRHQDDQKESLLSSIHAQLQHYLTHTRDHERSTCSDSWQDEVAPEALQLRFSLAGGMFDAIRRSYQLISDWAVLLTQLVAHQVVDAYNNSLCRSNLFTTLIDMLATLIHSTLADGGDDNNRKHYQNLMKKLKKEIGDRHGPSVQSVRQLLPLSKNTIIEVIACEPLGCLVDQKGNKITGFDSDKKQGLRLTDKQRVSSWELVEGGRNPAPLSWAWFAATKVERKPLTYENAHRLLKYHTHSLVKPLSYYLESLPLPPEDLETNESKQDNGSLDGSPTSAGKGRSRSSSCKKMKKSKPTTPTSGPPVPSTNGGPTGITPAPAQQPQFMQQQQQWFPPPGQNYYTPPAGVSPRSVAPPANTQSKQAITNMLRQRLPFNQMSQMQQQSGGYPGAPHPRGPPFPRQGMRQMQPNQMGQMQPNQMNPMSAMSGMGPMGQMTSVQMGPGAMGPNQMGAQQMGAGQMGATQMSAGQMGGMGGQMFGGQYGGMQQGYGGYGQQMLQGGQQQMMNQGMGQQVNQMSQQVNPMGQGVNTIAQNVGQMNQGVGQTGQMPQGMGQMGQGMGQMGQGMGQMGQMVQGGAMGGMNSQGGGMGPQGGNAMGGFPGQQSFQQNMMGGRTSQEAAYMAQQRQNARPQYNMQAPNVTMGGMGGPAPPYPRGIQPQQSAQYQQMTQQQRMRQQQMLAMQQQQQGGLVQHLQRQQYQPPY